MDDPYLPFGPNPQHSETNVPPNVPRKRSRHKRRHHKSGKPNETKAVQISDTQLIPQATVAVVPAPSKSSNLSPYFHQLLIDGRTQPVGQDPLQLQTSPPVADKVFQDNPVREVYKERNLHSRIISNIVKSLFLFRLRKLFL